MCMEMMYWVLIRFTVCLRTDRLEISCVSAGLYTNPRRATGMKQMHSQERNPTALTSYLTNENLHSGKLACHDRTLIRHESDMNRAKQTRRSQQTV